MVKELVIYPDERIIACTDVRDFKDESLPRLIEDMKETMEANGLDALAAIQIAHPFNIVIIKQKNGEYLELINPRILKKEGMFDNKERTAYYPDIELTVPRYEKISLIYETPSGETRSMKVEEPWLSTTIQRKIDYLFGGTPLDKVDKHYREKILEALAGKGLVPESMEVCPTFSRKDYITSFTDKILFFMGLSLLTPLFNFEKSTVENIYTFDKIAFPAVILLMIAYFVYAQYEAKKYKQCSSCQIGNQIGIIAKRVAAAVLLAIAAAFLLSPGS